jgi:type I restriction enzyme S subunit
VELNTVAPELLVSLDATMHQREIVEVRASLLSFKPRTIATLEAHVTKGTTPTTVGFSYEKSGIRFVRSQNVLANVLGGDFNYISNECNAALKRSQLIRGDVLINLVGASIGRCCVYSLDEGANTNQAVGRIRFNDSVDSHFVSTWLNCRFAQKLIAAEQSGLARDNFDLEQVRELMIPSVDLKVQKYIGDKVRQAERLRSLGCQRQSFAVALLESLLHKIVTEDELLRVLLEENGLASHVEEIFRQIESRGWIRDQEKYRQSRVPYIEMTERLDAGYYRPDFLANAKELGSCGLTLEQIDAICEKCNCGATPVDVEYEPDGQGLVRTSDVRPNRFQEKTVMRTRRLGVDRNSPVAAVAGDVLFTMSGTIGYAATVPVTDEVFSFSNTIARARVMPPNNPWFVAAFFNSHMGYKQSLRLTSGGIQGHVMPNPFKRLLVPVPNPRIQNFIGDKIQLADTLSRVSERLVSSAKMLVESLIERKVTEDELKHAQTRLEQDDYSADRAILSRLFEGGWDAKETRPLFSDLDAYFETLRMVKREQREVAAK